MLFCNCGAIKAESCYWMGEQIIKEVNDWINTTALACVQLTAWRCDRDWSACQENFYKTKFCRLNFLKQLSRCKQPRDPYSFFWNDTALCLRSAADCSNDYSFFCSFDLFFFSLRYPAHRQQGIAASHTKLIEANERKQNMMHLWGDLRLSLAFHLS